MASRHARNPRLAGQRSAPPTPRRGGAREDRGDPPERPRRRAGRARRASAARANRHGDRDQRGLAPARRNNRPRRACFRQARGAKILMPFGLDASIAASRAFEDEGHPVAASAPQRIRADEARAPARARGGSRRATRRSRTSAVKAWKPQGIQGLRHLQRALLMHVNAGEFPPGYDAAKPAIRGREASGLHFC